MLETCAVDLVTGQVQGERAGITLTSRERTLLAHLAAHPSREVHRDEIYSVWGFSDQVMSRAVDTTMRRLREKVERDPAHPVHLLTVFGTGYRFEPLREQAAPSTPSRGRRWLVLGERRVDLDVGRVHSPQGEPEALTGNERAALELLAERAGGVIETQDLVRALWGPGVQRARPLHSLLYRLRRKLEPDPDNPRYLVTVRGSGFQLLLDTGPSGHTVGTLVQVRWVSEGALWETGVQMATLVAELEHSSREAGGVPTGDGWAHLFTDPAAAKQWATALLARHRELPLAVALYRGPLVWWTEPSTGRTACAGPAALRSRELVAQAEPGALLDEQSPQQAAMFTGRERELAQLARLLAAPGLVTLVGAGGMGKTTLAERAAAAFSGPVAWCELGDAASREDVVRRVGGALDLRLSGARGELEVGRALEGRGGLLVVLDGWLADPQLLQSWRQAAPEARFLVTNARPLQLPGEQVLEVDSLPASDSGKLLAGRCSQPQVELVALAERLDGVPLALELAAARLGTHSPQEVLQQLQQTQLRRRSAAPQLGEPLREALVAALDWSWEQLSEAERVVLAQLSVFRGGFDAGAVEGVCRSPGPFVLDVLGALLDRSLVWTRGERFEMLDPVRDFARSKLTAPDEVEEQEVEERHARWYARWTRRLQLLGRDVEHAVEYENLVLACRWGLAHRDGVVAVDTAMGADRVHRVRGPFGAQVELLREVLELTLSFPWTFQQTAAPPLVEALRLAGRAQEGAELAREWLVRSRAQGDDPTTSSLLNNLALCEHDFGQAEQAWAHLEEALQLAGSSSRALLLGNAAMIQGLLGNAVRAVELYREALACPGRPSAVTFGNLGATLAELGRNDEAHDCCMQALALARLDGNVRMEAYLRGSLGMLALNRGELEPALDFTRRARELHRQVGNRRSEGLMRAQEGELLGRMGRLQEGRACCEEAVALHQRYGMREAETGTLYDLGALLAEMRDPQAEPVLLRSLELARETSQSLLEGLVLAELVLLDPRRNEARAWAQRAVELGEATAVPSLTGVGWQALAATEPDPALALEQLERAELAYASRDPMRVGLVRCERARLLRALGRHPEAEAALEAARTLASWPRVARALSSG